MTTRQRASEDDREIETVTLDAVLLVVASIAQSVCPGAEVQGRIKTLQSRSGKRLRNEGALGLDNIGVRVIVRDIGDCYSVITRIHARFFVLQREYDDYIEWPKSNGYQSLHTTILATTGQAVELQVRTRAMHALAEAGPASHRFYKQAFSSAPSLEALAGAERHGATVLVADATALEPSDLFGTATHNDHHGE